MVDGNWRDEKDNEKKCRNHAMNSLKNLSETLFWSLTLKIIHVLHCKVYM